MGIFSQKRKGCRSKYQTLELEKDALEVQVTIMEGEKRDFEDKIATLELQKSTAIRQVEELRAQVEELVAQRGSFEAQLKIKNERKPDITPFHDQSCIIQRTIHQL